MCMCVYVCCGLLRCLPGAERRVEASHSTTKRGKASHAAQTKLHRNRHEVVPLTLLVVNVIIFLEVESCPAIAESLVRFLKV